MLLPENCWDFLLMFFLLLVVVFVFFSQNVENTFKLLMQLTMELWPMELCLLEVQMTDAQMQKYICMEVN